MIDCKRLLDSVRRQSPFQVHATRIVEQDIEALVPGVHLCGQLAHRSQRGEVCLEKLRRPAASSNFLNRRLPSPAIATGQQHGCAHASERCRSHSPDPRGPACDKTHTITQTVRSSCRNGGISHIERGVVCCRLREVKTVIVFNPVADLIASETGVKDRTSISANSYFAARKGTATIAVPLRSPTFLMLPSG